MLAFVTDLPRKQEIIIIIIKKSLKKKATVGKSGVSGKPIESLKQRVDQKPPPIDTQHSLLSSDPAERH